MAASRACYLHLVPPVQWYFKRAWF